MIEIEKPRIETIEISEDAKFGKFVVEPLERGYGTTLETPYVVSYYLHYQVQPLSILKLREFYMNSQQ